GAPGQGESDINYKAHSRRACERSRITAALTVSSRARASAGRSQRAAAAVRLELGLGEWRISKHAVTTGFSIQHTAPACWPLSAGRCEQACPGQGSPGVLIGT